MTSSVFSSPCLAQMIDAPPVMDAHPTAQEENFVIKLREYEPNQIRIDLSLPADEQNRSYVDLYQPPFSEKPDVSPTLDTDWKIFPITGFTKSETKTFPDHLDLLESYYELPKKKRSVVFLSRRF